MLALRAARFLPPPNSVLAAGAAAARGMEEAVSRGFEVPTSGWFAATLDVTGAQAFDTHVDWIDVKVGGFSSSGTATVYLDSLSIDPPAVGPWDFASSASPLVVANEGNVHPEFVSGAITWRNY